MLVTPGWLLAFRNLASDLDDHDADYHKVNSKTAPLGRAGHLISAAPFADRLYQQPYRCRNSEKTTHF